MWRRSVYVVARRYLPLGFLETFDAPVIQTNCNRRMNSVTPQQSLTPDERRFRRRECQRFRREGR